MKTATAERRRWPRYHPLERRAHLGWWKAGTYRTAAARLIEVGRGGAAVEADALPPEGEPIWISSVAPGAGGWVEASVLPVVRRPRGPHRLRLIFRDLGASGALVEAAAFGRGMPAPVAPPSDPLAILGLSWPCSTDEVRRAYHRKALKEHPDLGGTQDGFLRLQATYAAALARCRETPAGRAAVP